MSWTSPLTALPHLSDEAVAAFADGVLSDTARHRAQSHMAGCAECSDAVYGQRAARAALRGSLRPTIPAGLFERLRELPITAELPATNVACAVSADGQPLFASFSAPVPASVPAPITPGSVGTGPTLPSVSIAERHPHHRPHVVAATHRRTSTRVGLGATAAAVMAVGVLVTTAANAGGVTPTTRVTQPSVGGRSVGTPTVVDVRTVEVPMEMTLLSVPTTGR